MNIAIIGGGAAGMMAVASLVEHGFKGEIHLFEKNSRLGVKVLISGGGRCNVTTGQDDIKKILEKYPRGAKLLKYALYEFSPQKVFEWFEEHNVPLKIEKDQRVFPRSDNGADVVQAFERIFQKNNVYVHYKTGITSIQKFDDTYAVTTSADEIMIFDIVLLTTGGEAFRHTGSTGDGYTFAENLGHTITKLAPSLHSFHLKDEYLLQIPGISFPVVSLSVEKFKANGPIIFTHKGISGPATFALSSLAAYTSMPFTLSIDFLPFLSEDELFQILIKECQNSKVQLKNITFHYIPKSLFHAILEHNKLAEQKAGELSHKIIRNLIHQFKHLECTVSARGKGDEFVTAGGVSSDEIDSKTFQSKISPNLFFAGEILDIDGFTGGFNLQNAWSTGYVAGRTIAHIHG